MNKVRGKEVLVKDMKVLQEYILKKSSGKDQLVQCVARFNDKVIIAREAADGSTIADVLMNSHSHPWDNRTWKFYEAVDPPKKKSGEWEGYLVICRDEITGQTLELISKNPQYVGTGLGLTKIAVVPVTIPWVEGQGLVGKETEVDNEYYRGDVFSQHDCKCGRHTGSMCSCK